MKNLFGLFAKSFSTLIIAAGLCAAPSLSHAGLLGTVADGTLNVGLSPTNYFDLSAVPGSAPVSQTVVDPGVEFPGNQTALQVEQGITATISADLNNNAILLTWINSGFSSTFIPASVFTFDLFPAGGQVVANAVFTLGMNGLVSFGPNQVEIGYGGFVLGGASSTYALYSLSFVNVPEPETYLLLGSMAVIALFAVRRKEAAIRA